MWIRVSGLGSPVFLLQVSNIKGNNFICLLIPFLFFLQKAKCMGKISLWKQKCRKLGREENKHSIFWGREDGVPEACTTCSTESSWQIWFFFLQLYLVLSPLTRMPECPLCSLPNVHQNACQHHGKILSKRNLKLINWGTYMFTQSFLKVCTVLEERCIISTYFGTFSLRWDEQLQCSGVKNIFIFKIFVPYSDFKNIFEKHVIPLSFVSPFSIR